MLCGYEASCSTGIGKRVGRIVEWDWMEIDTMHPGMSLGAFFNDRNLWKPVFISPFTHPI